MERKGHVEEKFKILRRRGATGGHVAVERDMKNAYKILVKTFKGKRSL